MKILSASQTRQLDEYTIHQEPIASIDLMERASLAFVDWFVDRFVPSDRPIYIFCGMGNNGGDGFAIARLLNDRFYNVFVFWCKIGSHASSDCQINYDRLVQQGEVVIQELQEGEKFPDLLEEGVIVDALFGSGLNRPITGYWESLLQFLNGSGAFRIAVDIPSGLFADVASSGTAFQAIHTVSFELPKLAFMMPENAERVGAWSVQPIGLHSDGLAEQETSNFYVSSEWVRQRMLVRPKFAHKGTFGHALLIAGSYGKAGAALLATRACLRIGAGLVSTHIPESLYTILQLGVPEAMVSVDLHPTLFANLPNLEPYKVIGIGPGLGQEMESVRAVEELLQTFPKPMVFDADALNILGAHPHLQALIPNGSILTPHPKEFERLFGKTANSFERLQLQKEKAQELGVSILLKGAHSCFTTSEGKSYFNSTGNPGMATAGSGDVLTGIITGLLGQGYNPELSGILGMYIHGLAGDCAAKELGEVSLIAGDLVDAIPDAILCIVLK